MIRELVMFSNKRIKNLLNTFFDSCSRSRWRCVSEISRLLISFVKFSIAICACLAESLSIFDVVSPIISLKSKSTADGGDRGALCLYALSNTWYLASDSCN